MFPTLVLPTDFFQLYVVVNLTALGAATHTHMS
jgi:hypothetical protein